MKKIFCIYDKSAGEFLNGIYEEKKEAIDEIASYDDDDAYLLEVYEMEESEYFGRVMLSQLYTTEEARDIDSAIQEQEIDQREWLYKQISNAGNGEEWMAALYAPHFKLSILHGGYATDEDFYEVKTKSFKEFLDDLRKKIDSVEFEY